MNYVLFFFAYIAYLFVIIAYAVKSYNYAKVPMHLRWELYPLPHEKGYGGSYLEELDWYEKPRRRSLFKNIVFMIKDYLYLIQYYERNKKYWLVVYPYHLGFYAIFLLHVLLFFEGFLALGGVATTAGVWHYLPLVFGAAAFIIGPIGCIEAILKRRLDKDLKFYASPKLYFNYVFFLAVYLSGLVAWVFFDPTLSGYREFYKGLVLFNPAIPEPATVVHLVLFLLFLFYLPYTRSLHYVTKFFTFFWVRWDDRANLKGSGIEKKVIEQLNLPVTWSAPHIQSGSKWGEVAQGIPEEK